MNSQAALVYSILKGWRSHQWTVQGFGFIRTKIADVARIHVWDSRLAVPLASTTHTHPWPLRSTIISGELINHRFNESTAGTLPYLRSRIATGEGGSLIGESAETYLIPDRPEIYLPGDLYEQKPEEIHRTLAQDGNVTLLERPQGPLFEEALTFWPKGTQWESAIPKGIDEWLIDRTIAYAIARWCA